MTLEEVYAIFQILLKGYILIILFKEYEVEGAENYIERSLNSYVHLHKSHSFISSFVKMTY